MRQHWANGRSSDERGVILVMTAILLVVLLAFSALVLDVGNGRAKRRAAQAGTDAITLAAAGELGPENFPDFDASRDAVVQYTAANIDEPLDWAGCTDPDALAHTPHAATHGTCVSYDSDTAPTLVRVKLPDFESATFFGGIIGSDSLTISAGAESEVEVVPGGFGGVWPFALTGSGSGLACIKYGSGGADMCAGHPTPGNFGKLLMELYDTGCTESNKSVMLRNNVASSADHQFSIYTGTQVHDSSCLPDPNTVDGESGQTNQGLHPGLLSADTSLFLDGDPGRLHRGDYRTYTLAETGTPFSESGVYGQSGVDDVPLWEFIDPSLSSATSDVPASCERATIVGPDPLDEAAVNGRLDVCFLEYVAGGHGAPVFAKDAHAFDDDELIDIQLTPRFGYVPHTSTIPPNKKDVHILGFRAAYLHAVGCQGGCNTVWTPGPWDTNTPSNKDVDQIAAYVFVPSMLPGDLATDPRGGGSAVGAVDVRLYG